MTDDELKKNYRYNPETGIVTRLARRGSDGRRLRDRVVGSDSYGYLSVTIDKKKYQVHRLAWLLHYGEWPRADIDHINGNKKDNRIGNLRDVEKSQNRHNRGTPKDNTSGFKGVCFDKKIGKYMAYFNVNGVRKHLGSFATPEEAAKVRNEYVRECWAGTLQT